MLKHEGTLLASASDIVNYLGKNTPFAKRFLDVSPLARMTS
jgi:hypothetical protein